MTRPDVEYLEPVVLPVGEPPADIGTGHEMRVVTEAVAADPSAWTPEVAAHVDRFFEDRSATWHTTSSPRSEVALVDLLDRVQEAFPSPVVELGSGTGSGTAALAVRFEHVIAGDLSAGMLERLPASLASRVRLDASVLPFADHVVGTLVCVNMMLFSDEVRRVLRDHGAVIWVNSIGECTPIHLSAEKVAGALGPGFSVIASRAGWGTWAVARRLG